MSTIAELESGTVRAIGVSRLRRNLIANTVFLVLLSEGLILLGVFVYWFAPVLPAIALALNTRELLSGDKAFWEIAPFPADP